MKISTTTTLQERQQQQHRSNNNNKSDKSTTMKSTTNARNNIILIKQYCTDKCIQVYYILPRCPRIDVGVSVVTNGHCQPLLERLWTIKPFVKTGPTNVIPSYYNILLQQTLVPPLSRRGRPIQQCHTAKLHNAIANKKDRRRNIVL